MKSKHLLPFISIFFFSLLYISCGDDSPCDNAANYTQEIHMEIEAVSAAASTWGANPTTENCNAFRQAYQNYIDALMPFEDCLSGADLSRWQSDLDLAQQSLDDLVC